MMDIKVQEIFNGDYKVIMEETPALINVSNLIAGDDRHRLETATTFGRVQVHGFALSDDHNRIQTVVHPGSLGRL